MRAIRTTGLDVESSDQRLHDRWGRRNPITAYDRPAQARGTLSRRRGKHGLDGLQRAPPQPVASTRD